MVQDYDNVNQKSSKRNNAQGNPLSGGKIKWLSLITCLVVLFVAAFTLAHGAFLSISGAHAASVKPGVSAPKHTSSPSKVGKSKPVLNATPLSLSFSASATTPVPQPQIVTIKNSGTRALYWRTTISPSTTTWITLPAAKTQSLGVRTPSDTPGQLKVYVNAAKLSSGTYKAQIIVDGTDQQGQTAGGSPQTINVTLTVS